MSEPKMNLLQKLAKIRAMTSAVKKDSRGYGYTYAALPAILANITAGMDKYGVSLLKQIDHDRITIEPSVTVNTKIDKDTKTAYEQTTTEMLVKCPMVFTWVDDESGEAVEVPWLFVGSQTDPSQAFGSAITYCTRYFLISYFDIAIVENDVDAYRSKQKEAADKESKEALAAIITEFDNTLRLYLADNPDKKADVSAFVKTYIKSGDYTKIKDAALAAKLNSEFTAKYLTAASAPKKKITIKEETNA